MLPSIPRLTPLALYYPEGHAAHAQPGHPERPERVEYIRRALRVAGWWDVFPKLEPLALPSEVLQTVHSPAYLNLLEMVCRRGSHLDADTYTTPASWQLAHNAAGGASAVATAVWRGEARRGFALTRPPGHHAMHGQGMGFCLLNNIAIAAEYLIQSEGAKRVAIVDYDLHHGNGTQDIFWTRRDVLYISTHQMPLYPGSGGLEERGAGQGEGYTANFPMLPGSGDQAFSAVTDELILPLLDRYNPEIILVSYGFDTSWRDPLGSLLLSASMYGEMIGRLLHWADGHCQGRITLVLEGGYDLEAAEACSLAVMAALLGEPFQDRLGMAPQPENQRWRTIVAQARQMWGI